MTLSDSHHRKLAQLKAAEAKLQQDESKARSDAAKKRADALRRRESAQRSSSNSTKHRYEREAVRLDSDAARLDAKAAELSKKVGANLKHQQEEHARLKKADDSTRRTLDREDERRRVREKQHAREVARLAQPIVRYVHEIRQIANPKPEIIRVAYLTANPRIIEGDIGTDDAKLVRIRVDKEVRDVREEVRRALYRDCINIEHWPAAMPTDIINALNDQRPHVLHFSGHAGSQALEFDNGDLADPQGVDVPFDSLARLLAATDNPPTVLVLNACDTLAGAEILLAAVPVVIATSSTISDLAASIFAVRFYAAIAAGQSIQSAIDQSKVAIDMLAGGEGSIINSLARADVDLSNLVLVEPEAHPKE